MSTVLLPVEEDKRRERAKEHLYVMFQVFGWGFFMAVQLAFIRMFEDPKERDAMDGLPSLVRVVLVGLILSHYGRFFINKRGWKELSWKSLIPRMVVFSAIQSILLSALCYSWTYLVLRIAWTSKYPPVLAVSASLLNGCVLFFGWLGLYFFYHLYDRLNRSEIERLQLTTSVKDAQLLALKSQVNPHFIFNSLNSLRALIDEDPARARKSVTQLANLLRYALQSAQRETVPFDEELNIVNDYLALEQVRHEERLRLRMDIEPETLPLPVPPMLLQTLVENAVKYGISNLPEGGEITISARRENGCLRIQVSNPGELELSSKSPGESTGLGLRNAADRLRLLFGERATLELRAASAREVTAEATIPIAATL